MKSQKMKIRELWEKLDSGWQNALLFVVFYFLYLFVNISVIPRAGYHWDETLDFQGEGVLTYVALGRWMLALWKCIFGMGCSPWTAGLFAGVLLVCAIVWQIRLLKLNDLFVALMYGVITVSMVQFSRMLVYSVQSDAVAGGMLAVTAAVALVVREKATPLYIILAAILLGAAMGIYQSIGLYMVVVFAGCALVHYSLREWWWRAVIVVVLGCCVYLSGKWVADWIVAVPEPIRMQYVSGQKSMVNNPFLHPESVMQLVLFVGHYLLVMLKNCFVPKYAGEWFYVSAVVPVMGLLIRSLCAK